MQHLREGGGGSFPLRGLRDRANEIMNPENFFSNRELKVLFLIIMEMIFVVHHKQVRDDISQEFKCFRFGGYNKSR